jgi:hypothetical protein
LFAQKLAAIKQARQLRDTSYSLFLQVIKDMKIRNDFGTKITSEKHFLLNGSVRATLIIPLRKYMLEINLTLDNANHFRLMFDARW